MFRFFPITIFIMMANLSMSAECIAHRGDSIRHPENSMAAIASAWKSGADVVELDVRMTADGVLVLFHDADINGQAISGLSHAQLLNEHGGSTDVSIPTLEKCLKSAKAGQRLLLDLKESSDPFLNAVVALVKGETPEGVEVMLQSPSFEALSKLQEMAPKGTKFFYLSDLKPAPKGDVLADELSKRGLQGITAKGRRFVDKDFVNEFRSRGLAYQVWTINPKDRMEHYLNLGVSGVITDDPAQLREILNARSNGGE